MTGERPSARRGGAGSRGAAGRGFAIVGLLGVCCLGVAGARAGHRIHNAGMRGHKGSLYEGGHRVPCFVRWPAGGIGGGVDRDALTSHIDWFPTLIELCGLDNAIPQGLEGFSMAALLKGETSTMPQRFLFQRSDHARVKQGAAYRPDREDSAVLSGKWRFVNDAELYDVGKDPAQEHDLAADHPDRVETMRNALADYWKSIYPETYDRPRPIRIGGDGEVLLTPLYGRPLNDKTLAFQAQVRNGMPCLSEWPLDVATAGTYRFEVRRWPREVDAPIAASLPPYRGAFATRGPGKALPVASVKLTLGDRVSEKSVPAAARAIVFETELPAGPVPLRTRLFDAGGQEISDAYYVYVGQP